MSATLANTDRFHQARWNEPIILQLSTPGERGVVVEEAEPAVVAEVGDGLTQLAPAMRRRTPPALPEMGQMRVLRHYLRLSQETLGADFNIDVGQGTCTMKYSPKVNDQLASSPKVTELHPLQDDRTVQGSLVLVSNSSTEALKDVARACLRQAKLKYQFVTLKPGEPEPDHVAPEDDGAADELWAIMHELEQEWKKTPTTDRDLAALRNQISARLPDVLKATKHPERGAEIQQQYDRVAQQLKRAGGYWEILQLKENWEQLDMLASLAGETPPPSGTAEAVRLKTGAMGVNARLQDAFPPNLADQLNKQVKRFIGGTGANFTPVIDALKAVEGGPTGPNLDALEQAAQHYLDHVERNHSEKDKKDKTTQVKILAAQKALRDVEFARKALRVREAQAALGPLPWDEEKTAKARDLDAQMEELGSKDKAAAAQQEFERLGGKAALEVALRQAGRTMPPDYATLTWGQRATLLDGLVNAQPNFERTYKALEPKFLKLRKQDPNAHELLGQADAIYKQTRADGKFVEGKQRLERLGGAIGERVAELERNPVPTSDLANAARRRLDQLREELAELPEDGAEAQQIREALDRGLEGLQDDETGEKALDLTQRALEKVETLRRRAAVLLDTYRKEQTATVRIFEELVDKDAQRANGLKAEFQKAVAAAIELGERKDYRGAIAEFDRIQARLRGALDNHHWKERVGDLQALKDAPLKVLGKAGQGAVFATKGTTADAPPLVVKVAWNYYGDEDRADSELAMEADVYARLGDHPNIARSLGMQEVNVPPRSVDEGGEYLQGKRKGLVLERLSGNIRDANKELKTRLTQGKITQEEYWGTVQHTLAGMLQGLDHMASCGFIHADIKDDNVMYDAETGAVKLVDMGTAILEKTKPGAGAPAYWAPERIDASQKNATPEQIDQMSGKVDVFALGGMLHQFGEGSDFNASGKKDERLVKGKAGPGGFGFESEYVKFVNWVLDPDPAKRPSAREALNHPFLRDRLLSEEQAGGILKGVHEKPQDRPTTERPPIDLDPKALAEAVAVQLSRLELLQGKVEAALRDKKPGSFLGGLRDLLHHPEDELKRLEKALAAAKAFSKKKDLAARITEALQLIALLAEGLRQGIIDNKG